MFYYSSRIILSINCERSTLIKRNSVTFPAGRLGLAPPTTDVIDLFFFLSIFLHRFFFSVSLSFPFDESESGWVGNGRPHPRVVGHGVWFTMKK